MGISGYPCRKKRKDEYDIFGGIALPSIDKFLDAWQNKE
jgi:hypothetical protein